MRRHRKIKQEADLDITSFMNLMIVLVPVLLLNMVFAQTAVLDLKLPQGNPSGDNDPANTSIEVTIRPKAMTVTVVAGGAARVVGDIKRKGKDYDYEQLNSVLKEVKKAFPDKRDIVLLSTPDTNYQTLVSTMDASRSYETVVVTSVVDAALFPEVSLGDAPELKSATALGGE